MATITITIIKSPMEIIDGIPSSIILNTNVPATIFYTLDSTDPTEMSDVIIGPLKLPTDQNSVTLKLFATDGDITSPIITQVYSSNISLARNPHDKVIKNQEKNIGQGTYPYGSSVSELNPNVQYGNTAGVIVYKNNTDGISDGYNAEGEPALFTNLPKENYDFIFSKTNYLGEKGRGIGTVPSNIISIAPRNNNNSEITYSDTSDKFFNPKALVIFQDSREEPFDPENPKINRPYFDLEDPTKARDGANLTTSATTTGSFVRSCFNPKDNTITYYYYDSHVNRWIISKQDFQPTKNKTENLSGLVWKPIKNSNGFMFKWIPFKYRTLI